MTVFMQSDDMTVTQAVRVIRIMAVMYKAVPAAVEAAEAVIGGEPQIAVAAFVNRKYRLAAEAAAVFRVVNKAGKPPPLPVETVEPFLGADPQRSATVF